MKSHQKYLLEIENQGKGSALESLYLWPAVDMWKLTSKEIQRYIIQRVGVSDYEVTNPISRPYVMIQQLQALLKKERIGPKFSLLDITFGDGINLWQLRKSFSEASLHGIDCCTDAIDTHEMVKKSGISLYKGYIQHLFATNAPDPFDIIIMLNTYRGWQSAKLREEEKDLPLMADHWFEKNGRILILTATDCQIKRFKKRGYHIVDMGKGEDASRFICLSKEQGFSRLSHLLRKIFSSKYSLSKNR